MRQGRCGVKGLTITYILAILDENDRLNDVAGVVLYLSWF